MRDRRSAYSVLVGKFEWKREHQEDLDVDGKVLLKMDLRE
jgi:hypothetical protein